MVTFLAGNIGPEFHRLCPILVALHRENPAIAYHISHPAGRRVLSEFYSRMDMPEAKGVSPIFSRLSADRRTDKAVLLVLGIYIKSHDFSFALIERTWSPSS